MCHLQILDGSQREIHSQKTISFRRTDMLEEEKSYFNKSVKQYRFLSKICLVFMFIPVAILIYCYANPQNKDANKLIPTLITGLIFFVAIYVGYMSLQTKADILEEIATKPGFDEHLKTENQDDRHIPSGEINKTDME
jgi:amino acid permease